MDTSTTEIYPYLHALALPYALPISSTCGVFGSAAVVGALLRLDAARMLHALGVAAVQSSGLVEALGTMAKSVSVGGAARNGLLSARLAGDGFTGPPRSEEHTSELQSLMRISYAVFCLKKKKRHKRP